MKQKIYSPKTKRDLKTVDEQNFD